MLDPSAFLYDQHVPLDLAVLSERTQEGTTLQDIRYASPHGGQVPAYLIFPSLHAPRAGVIFGHWGEGDREEFVEEATILARLGIVSLCPDAPFRRPLKPGNEPSLVEIPQGDLQWVVDVRRGVDLLLERFSLPVGRLGYVGHSYAATLAGAVAASEHRLMALVVMAGEPALSEWMLLTTHPALVHERETTPQGEYQAYLAALAALDACHYIGRASPSNLFFQFARDDEYLPVERGELYYALASEPKQIAWYDCKHAFNAVARCDRARFLCEHLGVDLPSAEIVALLEQVRSPLPLEEWSASGAEQAHGSSN